MHVVPIARLFERLCNPQNGGFVVAFADDHQLDGETVDHAAGHRNSRVAADIEGRGDWQLAMAGYKEILPLLYPLLKASQVTHDVVPDGIVERLHEGRMRVLADRSTTPARVITEVA